jgi:NAD(P)-dependent dehydrogenase (short-subunit alcohol dehydrogenase family)
LIRTGALELATIGITVNAMAPRQTEIEPFRAGMPTGSETERRLLSLVSMQRFSRPDELVAPIAFLLSKNAGFITTQTWFVDGSASIGRAAV